MGTLTGLMSLSNAALNADQTALNVVSNNVANQNTAGYTLQSVDFSADAVQVTGYSGLDNGVTATAVSQRDRILEQQLHIATQSSSSSSARLNALENVQSLFGLSATTTDSGSTALGTAINGLFTALTALSTNPTDAATQTAATSAASSLASAFNTISQGLSGEVSSLNSQVTTAAQQIDSLTATVATLNGQIAQQDPNSDAGTLEDSRQQAILQLSSLLGVDQISTSQNGITLTTSTGAVLVSGTQSYSVSTTSVAGNTALVAGDPPTVQSDVQGGSIGGMLEARDQDIPAMQSQMGSLAYAIGIAINTQNQAGTTSTGAAGTAIFSLGSSTTGAAASIAVTGAAFASAATGEGIAGTSNALALAALSTSALSTGATPSDTFSSFIGALGTTVSSATTQSTADAASLTQAQTRRDSLSAVSLDDEASQLTQYQRSYEAAAKVFTIVDEMFATVLNLGQETPVS
jgi:flagellar hook-associated protein 1 FlgK